ncbi:hypothetical protein ACQPZQ_30470 [Pseudonocardia sp. CA-142604]|uniref:hypothetical protein n=1 Tax=Pseudonocardia sp. CA-142604 TaxID=3240024 RepID=UPI003D8CAEB7
MAYIDDDVRNVMAQAQLSFVATIDPEPVLSRAYAFAGKAEQEVTESSARAYGLSRKGKDDRVLFARDESEDV